jgi:hypothetical protein
MRRPALRPRDDQVSELTRGQTLPLAPIGEPQLDVIFEAVARVWGELTKERPSALQNGDEAELNALMEARLNNLWQTDPLWTQLVVLVARGKETISFNGKHIEKRPDLSIFLTGRHPSFPIVVECKIIDRQSGKSIDLYCKSGISRFLAGEYAWANREALMIAYIRDDSSVDGHLAPLLAEAMARPNDPWSTVRLPTSSREFRAAASISSHGRNFSYPAAVGTGAPGDIALWHLWLNGQLSGNLETDGATAPVAASSS